MSVGPSFGNQPWPFGGPSLPLGTQQRALAPSASSGPKQLIMPKIMPNVSWAPGMMPIMPQVHKGGLATTAMMTTPTSSSSIPASKQIPPSPSRLPTVPASFSSSVSYPTTSFQAFEAALKRTQADLLRNLQLFQPGVRNRLLLALECRLPNENEWALQKIIAFSFVCPETFAIDSIPGLIDAMLESISEWSDLTNTSRASIPEYNARKQHFRALLSSFSEPKISQEPMSTDSELKKSSTAGWMQLIQQKCDMLIHAQDEDDFLFRRVLQIALILRNFSFIDINKKSMANNDRCRTFFLLLFYTTQHILSDKAYDKSHIYRKLFFDLQKHVWDTLESLGSSYPLNTCRKERKEKEDKKDDKKKNEHDRIDHVKKDPYLKLAVEMLFSVDKNQIRTALRLLLEWSFCDTNESAFVHVDRTILRRLCDLVILDDAVLRTASLDLLYQIAHLHSDAAIRLLHAMPVSFGKVLVAIMTEQIKIVSVEPSRAILPPDIVELLATHQATKIKKEEKEEKEGTDNDLSHGHPKPSAAINTVDETAALHILSTVLPSSLSPHTTSVAVHWLSSHLSASQGRQVHLSIDRLVALFQETAMTTTEIDSDDRIHPSTATEDRSMTTMMTDSSVNTSMTPSWMQHILQVVFPSVNVETSDQITLYVKSSASPVLKKLLEPYLANPSESGMASGEEQDDITEEDMDLDVHKKREQTHNDSGVEESSSVAADHTALEASTETRSERIPDTPMTDDDAIKVEPQTQQQPAFQHPMMAVSQPPMFPLSQQPPAAELKALTRERIMAGMMPRVKEGAAAPLPILAPANPYFPLMFPGPSNAAAMMNPYLMTHPPTTHTSAGLPPYFQSMPQLATSLPPLPPPMLPVTQTADRAPLGAHPSNAHSLLPSSAGSMMSHEDNDRVALLLSRTYVCEWHGCQQQFKLLDLWKHLTDDHVPYVQDGTYSCHWGHCRKYSDGMKNRGSLIAHVKSHIPDIYRIPMRADAIGKTSSGAKEINALGIQRPPPFMAPAIRPYGFGTGMANMNHHPAMMMMNRPAVSVAKSEFLPSTAMAGMTASHSGAGLPMLMAPMTFSAAAPSMPMSLSAFSAAALKVDQVGAPLMAALLLRQLAACPMGHVALASIEEDLMWWWAHHDKASVLVSLVLMELRRPLEVEKKKETESSS